MTEYRIEAYRENDHYPMICSWWTWHKFSPVAQALLPKNALIVSNGETPVCCGFLYSSDSGMGWIEFVVANPDARPRDISQCIDLLLLSLVELSRKLGQACLFTSSNKKGLIKRFMRAGFMVGDTATTQLVRASCQP